MKIYIVWITFFEPTLLIGGMSLTYKQLGEREGHALLLVVALILSRETDRGAYIKLEI
jgi:hypothetical protein